MSEPTAVEPTEWLRRFAETHGRPLRVLHIGNIANNAYLNARILNEAGADCDVLSDNFYHVMGSPEWEEVDFDATGLSQDLPDWTRVPLGGYVRPPWFAQGPLGLGVRYLLARRRAKSLAARVWSGALAGRRHLSCSVRLARLRVELRRFRSRRTASVHGEPARTAPADDRFLPLVTAFAEAFPDRPDQLRPADLTEAAARAHLLRPLVEHYDVVQAYAAEPILPLLAGKRPYVAFEHGTLRDIPFQQRSIGRLTALSYRLADEVVITNADNRIAAERLGLTRFRFVPHAVNERSIDVASAETLRQHFRAALGAEFVVFHPSRQHWDPDFRDPNFEKGNDIFVRGFARFSREPGVAAGAVFIAWGKNVADTKRLLAECGIVDRVLWLPAMPRVQMYRAIHASDVVADQFVLGAFGNITPQALFARRPALLRLDEEAHRWCFAELPPVLNASTPDDVYRHLLRLYRDREYASSLGAAGQDWYARYHSAAVVRDRLLDVYHDALRAYGAAEHQPA